MDELEEKLKKRDARFLVRMVVRIGVVLLAGVYFMLWLSEQNTGGCAARGFETLTETPATPPSE